jgi:hypothetical protein
MQAMGKRTTGRKKEKGSHVSDHDTAPRGGWIMQTRRPIAQWNMSNQPRSRKSADRFRSHHVMEPAGIT